MPEVAHPNTVNGGIMELSSLTDRTGQESLMTGSRSVANLSAVLISGLEHGPRARDLNVRG